LFSSCPSQNIVTVVQDLRRTSFLNLIVILSDPMQEMSQAALATAGADGTLIPTAIRKLELLVNYARRHGSQSRLPLRAVSLENEMVYR